MDIDKLAKAGTRAAAIAGSEGAEAVLRTVGKQATLLALVDSL